MFRTILTDCSELIIPIVNELFSENKPETGKVIFDVNEHFIGEKSGKQHKRITDSSFVIVSNNEEKKNISEVVLGFSKRRYHIECETNAGIKILKREFEYDSQIALHNGIVSGNELTVRYPESAVMFLRSKKNTPEKLNIVMDTASGKVNYNVHVMKVQSYSFDEIKDKKLIFLLPFYIFRFEEKFEKYNNDEQELYKLKQEYQEIREYLENEAKTERIDEYTKCTIIDMIIKVVKNIAVKYPNITKGVQEIMGGQVLDYEAKRILNRGKKLGEEAGIELGKKLGEETGIELGKKLGEETGRRQEQEAIVKRMILSGMETSVIMDLSMMTEEQIEELKKSLN